MFFLRLLVRGHRYDVAIFSPSLTKRYVNRNTEMIKKDAVVFN